MSCVITDLITAAGPAAERGRRPDAVAVALSLPANAAVSSGCSVLAPVVGTAPLHVRDACWPAALHGATT